jgi:hypothetical protein
MIEAVRTSKTSVDNHFTWQYIPEDNSEHQRQDFTSPQICNWCDLSFHGDECEDGSLLGC